MRAVGKKTEVMEWIGPLQTAAGEVLVLNIAPLTIETILCKQSCRSEESFNQQASYKGQFSFCMKLFMQVEVKIR